MWSAGRWESGLLRIQQSTLQQRLHVAPSVGDQEDVYDVAQDPVNHAVGFEKDLALIADSQGQQFFRIGATFG